MRDAFLPRIYIRFNLLSNAWRLACEKLYLLREFAVLFYLRLVFLSPKFKILQNKKLTFNCIFLFVFFIFFRFHVRICNEQVGKKILEKRMNLKSIVLKKNNEVTVNTKNKLFKNRIFPRKLWRYSRREIIIQDKAVIIKNAMPFKIIENTFSSVFQIWRGTEH